MKRIKGEMKIPEERKQKTEIYQKYVYRGYTK